MIESFVIPLILDRHFKKQENAFLSESGGTGRRAGLRNEKKELREPLTIKGFRFLFKMLHQFWLVSVESHFGSVLVCDHCKTTAIFEV